MKDVKFLKFKSIDFYLIAVFSVVYSVFAILTVIKSLYYWNKNNISLVHFPYFLAVIDWFTVILTMSYVATNTRYLIKKGWSWRKIIIKHVIIIIAVNTLIRAGIEMYMFSKADNLSNITWFFLFDRFMSYIDINYLIYFVMMFIIYGYYYNDKINKSKDRERILEHHLLNTKLRFLNSQIQPHFLFNSLNSIVYFISTNQDKAINMTIDLSDYLRETLNLNEAHYIPLNQELKILKRYLNLQKTRFGNQIKIQQNIEIEALRANIPPFLLQPIIENSIQHGFNPDKSVLLINISISVKNNHLEIVIRNNGNSLKNTQEHFVKGTGLSNIYNRLKTLYDNNFQITIHGETDGVCTFIKLPLIDEKQQILKTL